MLIRRLTSVPIILTLIALSISGFSAVNARAQSRARSARKSRPIELRNIDQLRTAFAHDNDKVRLVVLISPT